ncbi:MAG: site-2 protease family protein [Acidimicrobiia bacterium]|jgi:membrane-associated protease RseP (regulator of RpoE activity)|nr:MAG: site-2 protease family protein [Acidimicrobiia bacterium]
MFGDFTGAVTMVVALVGFVVIHEAGHFLAAKAAGLKATEFFIGFGPRIWSFKRGETEYGLKAIPAGGYVKIVGMNPYEEIAPEDEGRTYRSATTSQKLFVILSGIALNFFLAFAILWGVFVGYGDQEWVPNTTVYAVVEGSSADLAGIEEGDRLVSINGISIDVWDDVPASVGPIAGETVPIVVDRNGSLFNLTATIGTNEADPSRGFLGVGPDAELLVTEIAFFEGAGRAGAEVWRLTGMAYGFIGDLVRPSTIGELVSGVGGGEITTDARPVSIVGLARIGSQADELGLANVLYLMASINVILGAFNVIPLLPLDGGHAAIAIYEKVFRRPANLQALAPIAAAVIALFVFIGVLSILLDITNPFQL